MRRLAALSPLAAVLLATAACAPAAPHLTTPQETAAGSPLGPSYVLVPLPNDDDTLLGRVLLSAPENGRSLDEVSRPNECADKLTAKKEGPLASTFEDGQELSAGGKARAALATFGFEGDAQIATHFYYKLEVSKRVSQIDTTEYVACCKEKGSCGYGFVSALIYGDGEYATAAESSASASVSIPIAGGAEGFVKAKILHKRSVKGYVAAVITVTDKNAGAAITNPIGDTAAAAGITEAGQPETVKAVYDADKLTITDSTGANEYALQDGRGAKITENDFVRRFGKVTGSNELNDFNRNRRAALITVGWISAAAFPVFVGLLIYGAEHFNKTVVNPDGGTGQRTDFGQGLFVGSFAGAAVTGGIAAIFLGVGYSYEDGTPDEHDLSESDARLLVARYNRALLRKTIRDTQKAYQETSSFDLKVRPLIGAGIFGLQGSF